MSVRSQPGATIWAILAGAGVVLLCAVGLVAAVMIAMMMGAGGMMGGMMGGGMGGMMGGCCGPGMWAAGAFVVISGLLVLAGLILLAVWGIRRLSGSTSGAATASSLAILQERYARGEIDTAEYERVRADLLGDGGGP